ncbi:MAG: HAD family hydrolase [Verrucomicrobiota bacterium]
MLRNYKHIIWDWNGTLLNDAWLNLDVMNGLLRDRNMPTMSVERYMAVFDFPVIDYYRRLGFDFEVEPFEKVGTEFIVEYERRRHECELQDGARSLLDRIREAGLQQSILSAYQHNTLEEMLREHGIMELFDHVMGLGDHYAASKLALGHELMKEVQAEPHECLLIGDTAHDHEVATAIGADCLLIPSGNHSKERLEECGGRVVDHVNLLAVE